jgi:NAD(P)-dependent dehydrogenase (short-subunit alcohol dehydrogenase family)
VRAIENGGGKARFVAADLSRADEVRRLADEAGPVDILINRRRLPVRDDRRDRRLVF